MQSIAIQQPHGAASEPLKPTLPLWHTQAVTTKEIEVRKQLLLHFENDTRILEMCGSWIAKTYINHFDDRCVFTSPLSPNLQWQSCNPIDPRSPFLSLKPPWVNWKTWWPMANGNPGPSSSLDKKRGIIAGAFFLPCNWWKWMKMGRAHSATQPLHYFQGVCLKNLNMKERKNMKELQCGLIHSTTMRAVVLRYPCVQ